MNRYLDAVILGAIFGATWGLVSVAARSFITMFRKKPQVFLNGIELQPEEKYCPERFYAIRKLFRRKIKFIEPVKSENVVTVHDWRL